MAQYEKVFTKPYEDGYVDLPNQTTPITAETLNDKDTAIEHIEDFLDGQEFPTALSDLTEDETHRLVTDTEIAEWNNKIDSTAVQEQTTTTGQFTTKTGGKLESCLVSIAPKQNLHGYNNPWVGGAGKNKLQNVNTTRNVSGITYTVLDDGSLIVNRDSASSNISYFTITNSSNTLDNTQTTPFKSGMTIYVTSGINGSALRCRYASGNYAVLPDNTAITLTDDIAVVYVEFTSNQSPSNFHFYPMIRVEGDSTWEPYSNICPITGHSNVEVTNSKPNRYVVDTAQVKTTSNWQSDNTETRPVSTDYKVEGNAITRLNASATYNWIHIPYRFYANQKIYFKYGTDGGAVSTGVIRASDSSGAFVSLFTQESQNSLYSYEPQTTFNGFVDIELNSSNLNGKKFGIGLTSDFDLDNYNLAPIVDVIVNLGGTYYGGTLDVVSGKLTVDKTNIDMGSLNYTYDSANQRFYTDDLTNVNISYDVRRTPFICSCYQAITDGRPIADVPNGSVYNASYNKRIYIHDSRYTVPSDLKTALSGQTLVYPLATPQTIQLTPQQINTLIGENHLDVPLTGQSLTSAIYRELFAWDDVEDVVNLRVPISAIGTDESNNDNASQAYSQGDYFYKNGIAKAKTSIASGATFTLGTNYEIKTLAEILKALES